VRADAAANALFAFGYPTSIVVIAAPSPINSSWLVASMVWYAPGGRRASA
jgi:hypothetical protein